MKFGDISGNSSPDMIWRILAGQLQDELLKNQLANIEFNEQVASSQKRPSVVSRKSGADAVKPGKHTKNACSEANQQKQFAKTFLQFSAAVFFVTEWF